MSLSMRKRWLLVANETGTYGGGVPTPTNAVQCSNLNVSPLEGSEVKRDFIRQNYGDYGSIRVENYAKVDFETEIAGAGTAGTLPQWDALLKACNWQAAAITAVASEVIGVAITAPTTTVTLTGTAATANLYTGCYITIGADTRLITGYTSGLVATVDKPFSNTFAIGAAFSIGGRNAAGAVQTFSSASAGTGTATANTVAANKITLGATASITAGAYVGATITVTNATGGNVETREIIEYTAGKVATLSAPLTQARLITEKYSITAAQTYTPISSINFPTSPSAVFYFNLDGVRHVLLGARGTVSFDFSAKKIPTAKWTFTGLLGANVAIDASDSATVANWTIPATASTANTTDINLYNMNGGVFETLTIDVGNEVKYRQLIGAENVFITDRAIKAAFSCEAEPIGYKDWFAAAKTSQQGNFSFKHGQTAGNSIGLLMPTVQIANPKYADSDSIAMLSADLYVIPSTAGNDELRITVK